MCVLQVVHHSVQRLLLCFTIMIIAGVTLTVTASADVEEDLALVRAQLAQLQLERDTLKREVEHLRLAIEELMQYDSEAIELLLQDIRDRPKTQRVPDQSIVLVIREIGAYPMQPDEAIQRNKHQDEINKCEQQIRTDQERLRKMESENAKTENDWKYHKNHCWHSHDCNRCRSKPTMPNSRDSLSKVRLSINDAENRLRRARGALARIERECRNRILISGDDPEERLVQIIAMESVAERVRRFQPGERISVRGLILEADEVRTLLQARSIAQLSDES